MLIDRRIKNKLGINTYTRDHAITIQMWEPIPNWHGRVNWLEVSFTPTQALKIANHLFNPPKHTLWHVYKSRYNSGFAFGIGEQNNNKLLVGINRDSYDATIIRSGVKDYFPCHAVQLNLQERKLIAGLLSLWAGSELVGTKKKITTEMVLDLKDKE